MPGQLMAGAAFGQTSDGRHASLYRLHNARMRVAITDYGGRIVAIETADRAGQWDHVVLGFDTAGDYERHVEAAFGALLGRTANRIGGGCFTLDGVAHELSRNEGDSILHGGKAGF